MALIAGFGGYFVLTSLYLQNGLKFTAAIAGLAMTPIALATIAAGPCAPFLMKRLPLRTLAIAGLSLQLCGLVGLALVAPLGQYLPVVSLAFAAVFGSTSAFVALMGLALNRVPAQSQGAASGLLFTAQQIGLPAGVVITLALFALLPGADGALAAYGRGYLAPASIVALGLVALVLMTRRGQR
eukprot:gene27528-27796_t